MAGPHPVGGPNYGPDHGQYPVSNGHHVPHPIDAAAPPQGTYGDYGVPQPHLGAAKVGYYGSTHTQQDGPAFPHTDHGSYWH
ncbi:MAG TPA: hypothetical protein VH141_26855 [Pseudonocardia sp.]|nr:hypothetical protein [Pseudonocardia sp.]